MNTFSGKTIVVGITGSIAAYKTLEIIKSLKKAGADVHCIITHSAQHMIDAQEFAAASGNPVHTALFAPNVDFRAYLKKDEPMQHISLSDRTDLILLCPATANIMAKVAHGIADDLLSSTTLATQAPVIFCPAMNVKMWQHPATQINVKALHSFGYFFVDPEYGELACGYEGIGRLAHGKKVIEKVTQVLSVSQQLKGKKVIVTAGGTSESIDAVRVITNRASGKMGMALADAAQMMGAEVVLIKAHVTAQPSRHYRQIEALTVDGMRRALEQEIKNADYVLHTAAVSDFTVRQPSTLKLDSNHGLSLELTPQTKILEKLRPLNKKTCIVGFKAEVNVSTPDLIDRGFELLQSAEADFIIANDVGKKDQGIGADTNEVYVIDQSNKVMHIPLASKQVIAQKIWEIISKPS